MMSDNHDDNDDNKETTPIVVALDAKARVQVLDMIYAQARQKIREKGRWLTSQEAIKFVLRGPEGHKLINEMIDAAFGELNPELASRLKLGGKNLEDDRRAAWKKPTR